MAFALFALFRFDRPICEFALFVPQFPVSVDALEGMCQDSSQREDILLDRFSSMYYKNTPKLSRDLYPMLKVLIYCVNWWNL